LIQKEKKSYAAARMFRVAKYILSSIIFFKQQNPAQWPGLILLFFFLVTTREDSCGSGGPKEVTVEDKTTMEQLRLIQQLDDEDKHVIFKMIDTMLTNKKFKDFFQKNIAML
jgi:hypothetical protein